MAATLPQDSRQSGRFRRFEFDGHLATAERGWNAVAATSASGDQKPEREAVDRSGSYRDWASHAQVSSADARRALLVRIRGGLTVCGAM
jgi:hypothetical protein